MRLEFHQLDRRWEQLRVREPDRQRRLMASLAEGGQQTPIVVVADTDSGRYIVIDGHKRVTALEQLGRDTVEATVWSLSEADALLLDSSLRSRRAESALEQGWLLAEMERRFDYSLEQLARRFYRSASWVSRRLALVELLPESIQQQVREGAIAAQVAMKYLVPAARVSLDDCERLAVVFARLHCDTRQAGQIYTAWRNGSRTTRQRILAEPELLLKAQRTRAATPLGKLERDLAVASAVLNRISRELSEALPQMNAGEQQQAQRGIEKLQRELTRIVHRIEEEHNNDHAESVSTNGHPGAECGGCADARDCTDSEAVAPERTQGPALQIQPTAPDPAAGESRALAPPDPGAFGRLQGESRASP
jgi:ParB family chromosome partitioning protein